MCYMNHQILSEKNLQSIPVMNEQQWFGSAVLSHDQGQSESCTYINLDIVTMILSSKTKPNKDNKDKRKSFIKK